MSEEEARSHGLDAKDALNAFLDKLEKRGMTITKDWCAIWQENLRYFFSDQLRRKKKHKDWDWIIINYLWPSAMQEIAKLSKNHPRIICNPWEESDSESVESWQSILQWLWEKGLNRHGMRLEQIRAILDGKLFGYRVSKVFWEKNIKWDDEKKEWLGDVKYRLWHPAYFWASDEENIHDGACGTVRYVELDYAINRWPDFEEELRDDAKKTKDKIYGIWGGDHIRGQIGTQGTYPAAGRGGIDKGLGTDGLTKLLSLIINADKMSPRHNIPNDTEFVALKETYYYDYNSTDEKEEEDIPKEELLQSGQITYAPNGVTLLDAKTGKDIALDDWPKRIVKKWKQPKYPTGRYVIRAGLRTILNPGEESGEDPEAQRYPHSQWPFVVVPHYLLPHMWQGSDAIQLYKSSQDMINVSISHLVNNMKQYGDRKIAIEPDAVAINPRTKQKYKIGSGAGAIIRLARGAIKNKKFQIIDPAKASPAATQLYSIFVQEFKNLTGLQSIGKGEKQPGKMTATESSILAISSNDRIALQNVYEEEWIKQVAGLAGEICQANYSVGRMVRIVGQDKLIGVSEITDQLKTIRFDVDIEAGSTLPFDEEKRIAKYEAAFKILQQPIANPMTPEMLRVLEIPNWKKLLEKYEAWQLYFQFYQLYEQVKAGKIEPQDAVNALVQKATQVYAAEQAETVPAAQQQQGGQTNAPQ